MYETKLWENQNGRIPNNAGEHVSVTCILSRLVEISRWSFDNECQQPGPQPNKSNGEGGLPSVQLETPMVQSQEVSSKAGTGWSSEEFLEG